MLHYQNNSNLKKTIMSKKHEKREKLFTKYQQNLELLVENNLISEETGIYICPICLKQHKHLNEKDPLTLEDAPPKVLGGRANILTCKSCNNKCGYLIDSHLAKRMNEIDQKKLLPNTSVKVKTTIDGEIFNGTLSVDEHGKMSMFHSLKNNNLNTLNPTMEKVGKGKVIDFDFEKSTVIPEKLEYSLLKTAFLILFEKTGYSLILNKCYNSIREQLLNPDKRVYPEYFWFKNIYGLKQGMYFVTDKGYECFFVTFNLDTGKTKSSFLVVLPCPLIEIDNIIEKLSSAIKSEMTLNLYPVENEKHNYIDDLENIKKLFEWLEKRTNVN